MKLVSQWTLILPFLCLFSSFLGSLLMFLYFCLRSWDTWTIRVWSKRKTKYPLKLSSRTFQSNSEMNSIKHITGPKQNTSTQFHSRKHRLSLTWSKRKSPYSRRVSYPERLSWHEGILSSFGSIGCRSWNTKLIPYFIL